MASRAASSDTGIAIGPSIPLHRARMSNERRIEELFSRLRDGDSSAQDELFECVYSGLHRIARVEMAKQPASHTLQATALVNEAFIKLGGAEVHSLTDRAHFLRLAGKAMRQILVDHARRKATLQRAEPGRRTDFEDLVVEYELRSGGLTRLEEALARLEQRDPELVQLIELRFFAGRSMDEVADVLGISPRSAARRWEVARVYLRGELKE